jgi:hypothetical protein
MNAKEAIDAAFELHGIIYPGGEEMIRELGRLGFVIVPREPTFEILSCGADEISGYREQTSEALLVAREAWIAMLKAAQ